MPGLEGMEPLAELGKSWPEVRSIVVSAYGDPDRVDDASSPRADQNRAASVRRISSSAFLVMDTSPRWVD